MEKQLSFFKETKLLQNHKWEVFVDGASRNNPGPSGAGVYIKKGDKKIIKDGFYLGKKTNNQAEYLALTVALFLLNKELEKLNEPKASIIITSDSELLIKQMKGEYKVKNPELKRIKGLIDQILEEKNCKFKHVLREENTIADKLANNGIDNKKKLPARFIDLLIRRGISV